MADFDEDRSAVVGRAVSAGVNFVEIGFDVDSSRLAVGLARELGGICAVGIHPHNVGGSRTELDEAWVQIEAILSESPEAVAVGEIGLDFARNLTPRDLQDYCFGLGLNLSRSKGLPAVIHQREAQDRVLDLVRAAHLTAPVIFHCFTGDAGYAKKCLDLGAYLGLGGVLTYPKNGALRDAVRGIPLDRILLETDSPYLAPQSKRGKRNEPALVLDTGELVAGLLGLPTQEVLLAAAANARRAFGSEPAWKGNPSRYHLA
jgi:TatD DNase family protein